MTYAPLLVSVYNRKKHLENCINHLKKNAYANETILYIVSDNYYKEDDREIVEEIRKYIKGITGFKEIRCIFNKQNLGSHQSIRQAFELVLNEHGSVIFLEDDIEVSSYFLKYMNDGLKLFENDTNIFSICSYSPNKLKIPKDYNEDTYIWPRNSPWGFATWKNRWDKLDLELKDYEEFSKDKKRVKEFSKIAPTSLHVLRADRAKKVQALDVRISFNMYIQNLYSIYPTRSLVRNMGFDGSGEHCSVNNVYTQADIYQNEIVFNSKVQPNVKIYKELSKWHSSIIIVYFVPVIKRFPLLYNFLYKTRKNIKKYFNR